MNTVYLSVVIPAYNEQARIADTLYIVKDYLSKQSYSSEVIVVDDGSTDMTTEVVRTIDIYSNEMKSQEVSVILENVKNVGKGFSVARGMLKANGRFVVFTDADLAAPMDNIESFFPYLEQGFDVVIGSRRVGNSDVKNKPLYRRIMSTGFNTFVSLIAVRGIRDTQCGFKAFTNEAAHEIARLQKTYRFSFDVEQLYLADKLGYSIKEIPVHYVHQEGSTVNPFKAALQMIVDVLKIRFLHKNLRHRQRANDNVRS